MPHFETHELLDRRTFLGALAGGLAGWGLLACDRPASAVRGAAVGRRGVQLYTVRTLMERDVAGTLEQVAAIGYREVETAGLFDLTPAGFRDLLDRYGLVSPSSHTPLQALREDPDGSFEAAQTLNQEWVVVPFLDEEERTLEGFRRVAADLNRLGALARDRGLRMAYHNHDFEFKPLEGGGRGYDVITGDTDPSLVDLELDLYWVTRGGEDPVALFGRYPGRFALWHVKDMADRNGAQTMASVGQGEIDFPLIFSHADEAGLQHAFVEHDNPADPLASLRTSYQYLQQMEASASGA